MTASLRFPPGFDGPHWIERWDQMQARYLVRRSERFDLIARLVRATQPAARVLDLGCGPGSLTLRLLEDLPLAEVIGVDYDPSLLLLAVAHLARFGPRVRLVQANLRSNGWAEDLRGPFDAVVSATALHWLPPEALRVVYGQIARLLRRGGIFLNADHVGSADPALQAAWEARRAELRAQEGHASADDWDSFWGAYAQALGVDLAEIHRQMAGAEPEGPEEGMPLQWHFDALRGAGFAHVECFWRCDCDAIYGGMR